MIFVWDASAIHHAHQADRVDVLGDIASSLNSQNVEHIMTAAVAKELDGNQVPIPEWVSRTVHVDDLTELVTLTKWVGLISSAAHNRGEATALAWAEVHGAVAIVDDRAARRVARTENVEVHGVLWVVAEAIKCEHITLASGLSFIDVMLSHGARYPFGPGEFADWARDQKLLP